MLAALVLPRLLEWTGDRLVMINAATARVMPMRLIQVMTLTPPSARLARKYRQAIRNS